MRNLLALLLLLAVAAEPAAAQARPAAGTATAPAAAAPRTREMNDLNWMEFAEWVPARVRTVLLTVGTLEPHGVANNGADNTAPVAIARAIAADAGINAFIAPHVPYGVTGSMAPYPGAHAGSGMRGGGGTGSAV
ncbi:MAG: creatininase family protein [Gemmatimonadaceae bacterium]